MPIQDELPLQYIRDANSAPELKEALGIAASECAEYYPTAGTGYLPDYTQALRAGDATVTIGSDGKTINCVDTKNTSCNETSTATTGLFYPILSPKSHSPGDGTVVSGTNTRITYNRATDELVFVGTNNSNWRIAQPEGAFHKSGSFTLHGTASDFLLVDSGEFKIYKDEPVIATLTIYTFDDYKFSEWTSQGSRGSTWYNHLFRAHFRHNNAYSISSEVGKKYVDVHPFMLAVQSSAYGHSISNPPAGTKVFAIQTKTMLIAPDRWDGSATSTDLIVTIDDPIGDSTNMAFNYDFRIDR